VKPAAFDYVRAESLEEALQVLRREGPDARILAGGQTLIPMLNMRLARPRVLVDIMRVPGLDRICGLDHLIVGGKAIQQQHIRLTRGDVIRLKAGEYVKLTPRLTLNLGLRHDIEAPWVEVVNRMSWLNPRLANPAVGGYRGALEFAGYMADSCKCQTNLTTYYKNFQPRVGFAYSVNNRTVIRAGYGLFYDRFDVRSLITVQHLGAESKTAQTKIVLNNPTCTSTATSRRRF